MLVQCIHFGVFPLSDTMELLNIRKHSPEIQIIEKFTLMQTLNATDISTSSPSELLACLNGLKKNYGRLEDTVSFRQ